MRWIGKNSTSTKACPVLPLARAISAFESYGTLSYGISSGSSMTRLQSKTSLRKLLKLFSIATSHVESGSQSRCFGWSTSRRSSLRFEHTRCQGNGQQFVVRQLSRMHQIEAPTSCHWLELSFNATAVDCKLSPLGNYTLISSTAVELREGLFYPRIVSRQNSSGTTLFPRPNSTVEREFGKVSCKPLILLDIFSKNRWSQSLYGGNNLIPQDHR